MKTSPSLIRNVRAMLGIIRIITLVGLCITPLLLLPLPVFSTNGFVRFDTAPTHLSVSNDLAPSGTHVQFKTLTAEVNVIPATPMPTDLISLRRQTIVPAVLASCLLYFLVSHLLWKLFGRIEQGEVFSEQNLKLVRKIGAAIIACSLVETVAGVWSDWQLSQFVSHHLTFAGLTVQHAVNGRFDFRFMLTGFVVLVVAEVFRQGLALKHEAELTV